MNTFQQVPNLILRTTLQHPPHQQHSTLPPTLSSDSKPHLDVVPGEEAAKLQAAADEAKAKAEKVTAGRTPNPNLAHSY